MIVEEPSSPAITGNLRARFNPDSDYVIVEGQLLWHIGVVGIVASRVVREFYRPTLIIGGEGEEWRGSGRSIPAFNLYLGLQRCAQWLRQFGGHKYAAGLTMDTVQLPFLQEDFIRYAEGGTRHDECTSSFVRPGLSPCDASHLALALSTQFSLQLLRPDLHSGLFKGISYKGQTMWADIQIEYPSLRLEIRWGTKKRAETFPFLFWRLSCYSMVYWGWHDRTTRYSATGGLVSTTG